MMCNMMPAEDFRFIEKIQVYMLDSTNMTKDEAWGFAFRIWQSKEWLTKYLLDDARNDIAYELGKSDGRAEAVDACIHIVAQETHDGNLCDLLEELKEKEND